jgi:hypothetical protein
MSFTFGLSGCGDIISIPIKKILLDNDVYFNYDTIKCFVALPTCTYVLVATLLATHGEFFEVDAKLPVFKGRDLRSTKFALKLNLSNKSSKKKKSLQLCGLFDYDASIKNVLESLSFSSTLRDLLILSKLHDEAIINQPPTSTKRLKKDSNNNTKHPLFCIVKN